MPKKNFRNYEEFWQFYLEQHSKSKTKQLHATGLLLGIVVTIVALFTKRWEGFAIALFVGYGFAWYSHFVIEKNRPATFGHPVWSFASDFRMVWRLLTGKINS